MTTENLLRRFRARLESFALNGSVLLGVSGGSDSMSLFWLCLEVLKAENIAVAHLNHGLRDTASRDCDFVAGVCREQGVRFRSERCEVAKLAMRGESHEAAGRRLRYELFKSAAADFGCAFVATGHTRDDLAENTLMNIVRGSGLRGVAGMPRQRGIYIRPLLDFHREELRDYLRENGHTWVEDETNELDIYGRNRVRHQIMPALKKLVNAQADEHLVALAAEALAWREEREDSSRGLFHLVKSHANTLWPRLDLAKLRLLSKGDRVELLRWLARELELSALSRNRTDELDRLIVSSGRWLFQWGSEVDVTARDGAVVIAPAVEKRLRSIELPQNEAVRWGGWRVELLDAEPCSNTSPNFSSCNVPSSNNVLSLGILPLGALGLSVEPNLPLYLCEGEFSLPTIKQGGELLAEWRVNHWEVQKKRCDDDHNDRRISISFTPLLGRWRSKL